MAAVARPTAGGLSPGPAPAGLPITTLHFPLWWVLRELFRPGDWAVIKREMESMSKDFLKLFLILI